MLKTAYRSNKKGFTLIELLVVITIIAILATIGLVIYSSAQKSARISKRIQDLKAIQTALEIYYTANKSYPSTNSQYWTECTIGGMVTKTSDQVIPGFVPTYMPAFPQDPSMNKGAGTSCYVYRSDGADYKVMDRGVSEMVSADYQSQRNLIDPTRDGGADPCEVDGAGIWSWAVYSSATSACW